MSHSYPTTRFSLLILAADQDRGKALAMLAPDAKPAALGDWWLRLMRFELSAAVPTIAVSTYSTHFHSSSERMPTYAALYRPHEQPTMSDPAFLGEENFTLRLEDFRQRFGPDRKSTRLNSSH